MACSVVPYPALRGQYLGISIDVPIAGVFVLFVSQVPLRLACCGDRYMAQPDFKIDCAEFAEISDAPKALMQYLLALHKFVLAARPIEEKRKTVHKLRAFMKARQCAWFPGH